MAWVWVCVAWVKVGPGKRRMAAKKTKERDRAVCARHAKRHPFAHPLM